MKKPSFWQKLLHRVAFWSKNTYVDRYAEYQRTLSNRVEAYKNSLQAYNNNLAALERGENPGGLRAAYERAVEEAERKFGPSEKKAAAPKARSNAANTGVKPASKEAAQRLEDALLNNLLDGAIPKKTSEQERENLREKFRGHIRETKGYHKMILSGDSNISAVLNDPRKMASVYADVLNGIMEKVGQNGKPAQNNEPKRNNEMEMNHKENAPKVLGG
jgi:hypothetical protein